MFNLPVSKHTKSQFLETEWREWNEGRFTYAIRATLRWDDQCGNGYNGFSITGTVKQKLVYGGWQEVKGGCIHEDIAAHFPEYAHLIKWHLVSSDGPMCYKANTLYHASVRDYNGLLRGEKVQIKKEGVTPCWTYKAVHKKTGEEVPLYNLSEVIDCEVQPECEYELKLLPWWREGVGKERDLEGARKCAIPFPEGHPLHLSEADLLLPEEELSKLLDSRLVPMMLLFKQDLEAIGFTY